MTGLPRQAVWIAALIIVAMAAFGGYQGWVKSASGPADSPAAVGSAIAPGNTTAKSATALEEPEEPLPEALTEARVRTIARQEVQSALNPKPAAAPSAPVTTTPTPITPPPAAARPAPVPAAPRPADPAAEAGLLSGARP